MIGNIILLKIYLKKIIYDKYDLYIIFIIKLKVDVIDFFLKIDVLNFKYKWFNI